MRTSTYNYNEAVNEVKFFFAEMGIEWNGEKYIDKYIVTDKSADCDAFPCPHELHSWSGETSAVYVEDEDLNEVFAVAYWTDCPLPYPYKIEQSISGYYILVDNEDNYLHDDPACEDVYDEASAIELFKSIIAEL